MNRLLFLLLVFLALFVSASAQPCMKATTDCSEWVTLGDDARSLVYRTYALEAKNEKITRALIVVHGQGRDADNYFRTALAAGFLANAFDDTIIIAPRFASNDGRGCRDTLAADEISWSCSVDRWRSGVLAPRHNKLTSYD